MLAKFLALALTGVFLAGLSMFINASRQWLDSWRDWQRWQHEQGIPKR